MYNRLYISDGDWNVSCILTGMCSITQLHDYFQRPPQGPIKCCKSPRRFLNVNEGCNLIYIVAFSLTNLLLKLPGLDFVVSPSLTSKNMMPPTEPLVLSLYALQLFPLWCYYRVTAVPEKLYTQYKTYPWTRRWKDFFTGTTSNKLPLSWFLKVLCS